MKYVLLLIALTASACDREPERRAVPAPAATEPRATAARQSQPPKVIPLPKDQEELDRLILAGYTPHAEHLHPPGVKSCPLAQGDEAVM